MGAFIYIPNMSQDGIKQLTIGTASPAANTLAYQSQQCGQYFGIDGMGTIQQPLVSRQQPFVLGVYSDSSTSQPSLTGFSLDYTQLPC